MSRAKKNREQTQELCDRLIELIDVHLRMSDADIASALGYRSGGTLHRVRHRRDTFPDVDRLARLAEVQTSDGERPNVDWLITGRGAPLVPVNTGTGAVAEAPTWLMRLKPHLDKSKAEALEKLLTPT